MIKIKNRFEHVSRIIGMIVLYSILIFSSYILFLGYLFDGFDAPTDWTEPRYILSYIFIGLSSIAILIFHILKTIKKEKKSLKRNFGRKEIFKIITIKVLYSILIFTLILTFGGVFFLTLGRQSDWSHPFYIVCLMLLGLSSIAILVLNIMKKE